ncbi:hypothetical protein [Bacillus alveayuensis]|uniref:hypothetical protein n=1 Tax=Aeribacillus alveayuensis TaxID=279215 RepID=UPI000A71A148|nr:hypothetical protein [Bacillus alveayuensis]
MKKRVFEFKSNYEELTPYIDLQLVTAKTNDSLFRMAVAPYIIVDYMGMKETFY